jgi:dTDP-glucose 4,6-dehydratase
MINNALAGKPLPIYGDGKNIRDWLYVEDHCRAIDAVVRHGRDGETYNVGGGNEWANIDIVHALCDILDAIRPRRDGSYRRLITFVPDRPGHDRRYAIDSGKITHELDWRPLDSFTTGLRKTVDWYLANDAWMAEIRSGRYRGERLGLNA